MTPEDKPRSPRAFKIDSDGGDAAPKEDKPKRASQKTATKRRKPKVVEKTSVLTPTPDSAAQRIHPDFENAEAFAESILPPPPKKKRSVWKWSTLFWSALIGLISLSVGLWVDQLITQLFARSDWLGWLSIALTLVLAAAAVALILREVWGFLRMRRIDQLRERASTASKNDDMKLARSVLDALVKLYQQRPETARGRAAIGELENQIIDGKDLIGLAERDLMQPLDQTARAMVMASAKRVSVVTAVSPRAIVDIGYVLVENTRLIRQLADLYGGRPGTLGFWKLFGNVVSHLAVTGTIAIGEGLIQQVVGQGLAARLSTKLGEGVINGLLTARIGIAAIDVCRPLPFTQQSRPTVKDFLGELIRFSNKDAEIGKN